MFFLVTLNVDKITESKLEKYCISLLTKICKTEVSVINLAKATVFQTTIYRNLIYTLIATDLEFTFICPL